jgi:SAM-dependent methyltransferase
MIDLAQLPAAEMAAQLGRPTGDIGVAVGDYMNRINADLIKAVYGHLAPPRHGRVLEIGLGNGKHVGALLALAPGLSYAGVDVSHTMVCEARKNNEELLQQGRLSLYLASVESMPFPDATFDRALAVNTIYFWPDQLAALSEIRRVLRDDALLVLASMTPETSAQSQAARPEYGFSVPDRHTLEMLHRDAGFRDVSCDLYEEQVTRLDGTSFHRVYHMVRASP